MKAKAKQQLRSKEEGDEVQLSRPPVLLLLLLASQPLLSPRAASLPPFLPAFPFTCLQDGDSVGPLEELQGYSVALSLANFITIGSLLLEFIQLASFSLQTTHGYPPTPYRRAPNP